MDWNTPTLPNSLHSSLPHVGHGYSGSSNILSVLGLAHHLLAGPDSTPTSAGRAAKVLRNPGCRPLTYRQQLQRGYLQAWAAEREGDLRAALVHLEDTLDVSDTLHDWRVYCDLAWRAGVLCRQLAFFDDVRCYLSEALKILLERGDSSNSQLQFDLHLRLASTHFESASFSVATQHLEQATLLLPSCGPEAYSQAASLDWMQAILYYLQGRLDSAMSTAMTSADYLEKLPPSGATVYIRLIVGEIALAQAKCFFPDPGTASLAYDTHMTTAERYIHAAWDLVPLVPDRVGEARTRLLLWQLWRLQRREPFREHTVAPLQTVVREAEALGDMSLIGQAYTALGEDFSARGEEESALTCYRIAVDILLRSKFLAVALLPRRALRLASEMSDSSHSS